MKRTVLSAANALVAVGLGVSIASAQGTPPPSGIPILSEGPRYLPSVRETTTKVPAVAPLKQEISLQLDNVSLDMAINTIARLGGIDVTYRQQLMHGKPRVTIAPQKMTVEEALRRVLSNTGLRAEVLSNGRVVIARTPAPETGQETGSLVGYVLSSNGEPIAEARVQVVGTKLVALTNAQGLFRITGLALGDYVIRVTRFGYKVAEQRTQIVGAGDHAVQPISLTAVVTQLSDVVTTATGEQRRVELGNSIASIKADSVVARQPVNSLAELLAARAPGLQVLSGGGSAGAPSRIRIRGASSTLLNNDPIVVIDGVRINAVTTSMNEAQHKAGGIMTPDGNVSASNRSVPSPLDNIDINTIESIDILKGPSASSLYGTDAANGVIVIKTRRGRPGQTRVSITGEQGVERLPRRFPDTWVGWGASGTQIPARPQCSLRELDLGECVRQDSVTHFNPNNYAATTTYGDGSTSRLNANVSGGWPQLQHFLSASFLNEIGMAKLPDVEGRRLERARIPVPQWMVRPNSMRQYAASSRITNQPTSALDISLTTEFRDLNHLDASNGVLSDLYSLADTLVSDVSNQMADRKTSNRSTIFGALQMNYRATSWLSLRTAIGAEKSERRDESLRRPSTCLGGRLAWESACNDQGARGVSRGDLLARSADVGGSVSLPLASGLTSRTSFGAQYNRSRVTGTLTYANGLAYGSESIDGALKMYSSEEFTEQATAGWFAEQQFAFRERMFVRGAFRRDAGSAFGKDADVPVYPKFDASWLVSEESFFPRQSVLTRARLRIAYGQSGQQPTLADVTRQYGPRRALADSQLVHAVYLRALGNYIVRPERGAEWEGGADLSFFSERVTVDLTSYRKRARDVLHRRTLSPSVGASYLNDINLTGARLENIGTVENRGTELSATLRVVDRRFLQWDVTIGAAANRNTLVKLGDGVQPFGSNESRMVEGYPLFSQWRQRLVGYRDVNGDGILQDQELVLSDSAEFVGSSLPTSEVSYHSSWALLQNRLRVGTVFRRVNGLANINYGAMTGQRGLYDRTAPLAMQAFARMASYPGIGAYGAMGAVSYLRFSELTVGYDIPPAFIRSLKLRSASVTLLARNLGLWTRYSGLDPDVNTATAIFGGDAIRDLNGTPEPRAWSIRFNLGY